MAEHKIAPDTEPTATDRLAKRDARAGTPNTYRLLEVRETDAVLEMEDGRVFIATFGDGVNKDDAKKGMTATITSDGMDRSDAPKDAKITRLTPKE